MADKIVETNNIQVLSDDKSGKITFASDVIAIIAGLAASDVKGIAGMSGGVIGGIGELLGRKNLTKGVKVEVGNEETAVDLYVIVDYGVKIHEVCSDIQAAVKKAIETMTGMKVVEVNVFVQGVNLEQPKLAKIEEAPATRVK